MYLIVGLAAAQEFSRKVGWAVLRDYDLEDGSDLCYNLLTQGAIKIEDGEDSAARIVAQHLVQA